MLALVISSWDPMGVMYVLLKFWDLAKRWILCESWRTENLSGTGLQVPKGCNLITDTSRQDIPRHHFVRWYRLTLLNVQFAPLTNLASKAAFPFAPREQSNAKHPNLCLLIGLLFLWIKLLAALVLDRCSSTYVASAIHNTQPCFQYSFETRSTQRVVAH